MTKNEALKYFNEVDYSDFINFIEDNAIHKPFETRLDCITWFVTIYGCIDDTMFGYIKRAYADGFFKG